MTAKGFFPKTIHGRFLHFLRVYQRLHRGMILPDLTHRQGSTFPLNPTHLIASPTAGMSVLRFLVPRISIPHQSCCLHYLPAGFLTKSLYVTLLLLLLLCVGLGNWDWALGLVRSEVDVILVIGHKLSLCYLGWSYIIMGRVRAHVFCSCTPSIIHPLILISLPNHNTIQIQIPPK